MREEKITKGLLVILAGELSKNALFEGISEQELIVLLLTGAVDTFESGEIIEHSGNVAHNFYIQLSGIVSILERNRDSGNYQKLTQLDAGDKIHGEGVILLGEMGFYTPLHKRLYGLRAESKVKLLTIDYTSFAIFIKRHQDVNNRIIELANNRYKFSKELVQKLFY